MCQIFPAGLMDTSCIQYPSHCEEEKEKVILQHLVTYLHNVQTLLSVIQWFPTSKRKAASEASTQHALRLLTFGAKQWFNHSKREPIRPDRCGQLGFSPQDEEEENSRKRISRRPKNDEYNTKLQCLYRQPDPHCPF